MSSLSTEYKDFFQVANYGIAGHYNLHFDFFAVSHHFSYIY